MTHVLEKMRKIILMLKVVSSISWISTNALAELSKWIEETWSHSFYAGLMTSNRADELLSDFDYADNNLVGYALAYDRPLADTQWSVGFELQLTNHFGDESYSEIGLPITVRYRPENPWLSSVEGFSFGLGMSHATEVPKVEVDSRGASRRNLVYWMLEAEFKTRSPHTRWFMRIHHRSDAWGTFKPEGGSNAVVLGLRQDF